MAMYKPVVANCSESLCGQQNVLCCSSCGGCGRHHHSDCDKGKCDESGSDGGSSNSDEQ